MSKYLVKYILPLLFLVLSVSPAFFVYEDWFLLPLTIFLIIAVFLKKGKVDNILYFIIIYWVIINLIAFRYFGQSFSDTAYTFFGSLMRIILAYMILKFCGYNLFFNAERISFIFICIGLPLFFITEFYPSASNFFELFNVGSMQRQALDGGWNILVFNHNPWTEFRFSGFAWEPGACALVIIFSLVICIYRDGWRIDIRKLIYSISLILTFSTSGFLAFGVLVLIYSINVGRKSLVYLIILVLLFIPLAKYAYKQDFMSVKINYYLEQNKEVVKKGFENKKYTRLTRLDAVYLGAVLLKEWPVGFGVVTKGRISNNKGAALIGSNALIEIAIKWGVFGIVFFLISIYRFSYLYYLANGMNKSYLLLILPLLVMFFSNPVDRSPILMSLVFYPYIYGRYFNKHMIINESRINQ